MVNTRELAFRVGSPQFEELVGGGLMVYNVPALMEGTWTDSLAQTPLFYTREALQKYADNWVDNGLWSRHTGGQPRPITDKIGEVKNPRYKLLEDKGAVLVDLFLHGATLKSREAISMVKNGLVNYVSVEHGGEESYNPVSKFLESVSLVFSGLALVSKGACETCTIAASTEAELKAREAALGKMEDGKVAIDRELDDVKALLEGFLKQQAEDRRKEQEALEAQLRAQRESHDAALLAQKQALEEANKKISESLALAKERLDKLEKSPVPPATVVTPVAEQNNKTEAPVMVPSVRWNKKTGEISRVD